MSSDITLRITSGKYGTKRVTSKISDSINDVYNKVKVTFSLPDSGWSLCKCRDLHDIIARSSSSMNYKHGDILYLSVENDEVVATDADTESVASASSSRPSTSSSVSFNNVKNTKFVEDQVDKVLSLLDGKIKRSRCRHVQSGKCFHCTSIEPYDEEYLKNATPPIKFLSFHSYIRKLTGGQDKGKFVNLENLRCKIKSGCKEHLPWPEGICTNCQPNAVTLTAQKYRHVDYIQFENRYIMEKFLDGWRFKGHQRLGFLFGTFEQHKDTPLGIKAVVTAIYEPKQITNKSRIELAEDYDEDLQSVISIAAQFNIQCVGWIFTDLMSDETGKGTVKQTRGKDSYFLSAEECIMAATFQNKFPNACRLSSEGHFGSKFVTVVVTGDSEHQVIFEGYQVSNQGMALVRDDCLVPTIDANELGYIRESTSKAYVPDVFYSHNDEYGNDVTKIARPVPVIYLLVDMAVGFPKNETYLFYHDIKKKHFAIEGREVKQNFAAFCNYVSQFSEDEIIVALNDLHVLFYLYIDDLIPIRKDIKLIASMICSKDCDSFKKWTENSDNWQTLKHLVKSQVNPYDMGTIANEQSTSTSVASVSQASTHWICIHCTYMNERENGGNCEICSLPKPSMANN